MTKSKLFILTILSAAALNFTGCDTLFDYLDYISDNSSSSSESDSSDSDDSGSGSSDSGSGSSSDSGSSSSTDNTKTWTYNSKYPLYEVGSKVTSVTIENLPEGKTLYLVKRNTSSNTINSSSVKGLSSDVAARSTAADETVEVELPELPGPKIKYFNQPELTFTTDSSETVAARTTTSTSSVTPIDPVEGTTTKTVWVDCDTSISQYTQKTATLRKIGTYCYVWVVDGYWTTDSSQGYMVNSNIVDEFASKFDEVYPMIRNVFGEESEYILDVTSRGTISGKESISNRSDTGSMVNIVIYDIGADYNQTSQCGVLGYFHSKDYAYCSGYTNSTVGKSNVGKYFYVDSSYAVSDFNMTLSVLVHEFQHMINYNQKTVRTDSSGNMLNLSPSTNFNEMLSMLCEDMMQEKLGINDEDSPKARFSNFNALYYASGINEYRTDDYASLSYATAYAFGAWIARQYGGAAVVREMSTNAKVDMDSVVAAVNTVNSTSYRYNDLFERFLLAVTGSSTAYKYNQDADLTMTYSSTGYKYPMTAFNPWSEETYDNSGEEKYLYSLKGTVFEDTSVSKYLFSGYDFDGPLVFGKSYSPKNLRVSSGGYTYTFDTLRPSDGISIHGVVDTDSLTSSQRESYTLKFTTSSVSNVKLYLIVQ